MSFLSHARKRFSKIAKRAAKVAVPVRSKGAFRSIVHGVEKIGKVDATIYTVGLGGIAGAAVVHHNPKTFGKSSAVIAGKVMPLEKVGLGVAGGIVAGGVGAEIGQKIGNQFGDSSGSVTAGDGTGSTQVSGRASSQAFAGAGSSATMWIVAGGSVLLVVVLIAATKKRRK